MKKERRSQRKAENNVRWALMWKENKWLYQHVCRMLSLTLNLKKCSLKGEIWRLAKILSNTMISLVQLLGSWEFVSLLNLCSANDLLSCWLCFWKPAKIFIHKQWSLYMHADYAMFNLKNTGNSWNIRTWEDISITHVAATPQNIT